MTKTQVMRWALIDFIAKTDRLIAQCNVHEEPGAQRRSLLCGDRARAQELLDETYEFA